MRILLAALLLAALTACTSEASRPGAPSSPPGSVATEDVPAGPATTAPYLLDGVLHVGGAEIPTELDELRFAAGTTVVGRTDGRGSEWRLVVDGDLVPLVRSRRAAIEPELSPDGAVVAWAERRGDRALLTLWDVVTRRVVGRASARVARARDEVHVHGIDLDHRVYVVVGRPLRIWDGGRRISAPVDDVPLEPYVDSNWPRGLMFRGQGGREVPPGTYGTVAGGVFQEAGTIGTAVGTWSPDGRWFAYAGDPETGEGTTSDAATLWVHDADSGELTALPWGAGWEPVLWESATAVLVSDGAGVARCDVVELACEPVADAPTGSVVWPQR